MPLFIASILSLLLLCQTTSQSTMPPIQSRRPTARAGHSLVYEEQLRLVLLLNGYQPPLPPENGEVWGWDGKTWGQLPGSGPTARTLSAAAYDSQRKRVVIYGGIGNAGYSDLRGDTWEWDGTTWFAMNDTSAGTRDHHSMVYDKARGKVVMYGGLASGRDTPVETWKWATDTWEWDGSHWNRLTAPGPGPRAHFAMIYDTVRKHTILFGGSDQLNQKHNDTWSWDGRKWKKLSSDGPPPLARHRMAFDRQAGVIVLYGGAGKDFLESTWVWNGVHWTEIKIAGPGKRFLHAMAYDENRGRVVLYGGNDGEKDLSDTWEWDGSRWQQVAP
jgi:hypothetical protein